MSEQINDKGTQAPAGKREETQRPDQGFTDILRRWERALDRPVTFLVTVIGLAGAYYAVVEWRVRSIVKDPDFVSDLARRARPAMVFDSTHVIADMGAFAFLESLPEVMDGGGKIIIRPKKFLPSPPIVESLDFSFVSVTAAPGKGISWEVSISARTQFFGAEGPPTNLPPPRFRLEIVPPY
jgi:hypothetical protein